MGSHSHWVCIGESKEHIKEFKAYTEDLHELCKWLKSNGIRTVAMESTGFYWKQLFLMLQSYELEAVLVNASQTKHAGGRKIDMADCQWLWRLGPAHGQFPARQLHRRTAPRLTLGLSPTRRTTGLT